MTELRNQEVTFIMSVTVPYHFVINEEIVERALKETLQDQLKDSAVIEINRKEAPGEVL